MNIWWQAKLSSAAVAALFTIGFITPAQAVESQPAEHVASLGSGDLDRSDTAAPAQAWISDLKPGESQTVSLGTAEMTLSLGEEEIVQPSDVSETSSLSKDQIVGLKVAVKAGTVRSAHWSQFVTGGSYTNTQNGTAYWDGSHVWVTQTRAGYTGSQNCFNNYTLAGWQIQNIQSSDTGSTRQRKLFCGWNVVQPIHVTTSFSMTATINQNSTISGAGSSIG